MAEVSSRPTAVAMEEAAGGKLAGGLARLLRTLALVAGAVSIGLYLAVALLRLGYPYHLEWMEGGSLHHVRWILGGHLLYARPSYIFTPYTYPPLYFYVSAAAAWLLGDGFLPLRLVSFASSLGCFALLFLFVKRETESAEAGFLAAALFAATFRASGSWLDLARIDSLFLLLLLAAIYLVRFGRGNRAAVAAALLLTLSYLTKQTALGMMAPLAIASAVERPAWSLRFTGALLSAAALATLLLDRLHHGWFHYYVFDLPAELPFSRLSPLRFLSADVLKPLWIAVPIGVVYLLALLRRTRRRDLLFYALLGLGMVGAAYLGRRKIGGFLNALLPSFAYFAILFGLAVGEWTRRLRAAREDGGGAGWRRGLEVVLYLVCIAQSALLFYDPRLQIPSSADREAGDRLVRRIKATQGAVLLPEFGYLAGFAGKEIYAHSVATYDVMRGKDKKLGRALLGEMKAAVRADRFAAIIFAQEDWADPAWFGDDLKDYTPSRLDYRSPRPPAGKRSFLDRGSRWGVRLGEDQPRYDAADDVFLPLVGYQLRPTVLYTRERP